MAVVTTILGAIKWFFLAPILGLIAGFIGSKIVNKKGEGFFLDILLGIVGALIGSWVFRLLGFSGVTGLNLYSIGVAVLGSILFLLVYHFLFRRGSASSSGASTGT